jgi:hypothetical protein
MRRISINAYGSNKRSPTFIGKQRDLLILFSQSYPWDHIGVLLGMTPESARTLCYRLIRRIRQAMGVKFRAKDHPSEIE